jgi:hypothetical protein
MASGNISVTYNIRERGKTFSNPYNFDDTKDFLAFLQRSLIFIAQDALREEQSKGFDEEPVQIVDNKRSTPIEKVNPFGKIQFVARSDLKEILAYTFDAISERTKVVSGEYLRSNVVSFNGQIVANDRGSFYRWLESVQAFRPQDKVRFINIAPYARKLERLGISRGANGLGRQSPKLRNAKRHEKRPVGTKFLVPNGTYSLAYRAVQRKYKNNSLISFEFRTAPEMSFQGDTYKTGPSKGKSYLYPTILIYAVESGLKGTA